MKHRLFYFSFLAALGCTAIANAQVQNDCTTMYWGSQTHYNFVQTPDMYTATPNEYQPVFINYVGCSGAAHLKKDVTTTYVYNLLHKADSAKALNEDGKKLYQMLAVIQSVEKGKNGSLTKSGAEEMHNIGARMLTNFGGVLSRPCLKLSAVNEGKIIQSMEALLTGLNHKIDAPGCEKPDYKDDDNLSPQLASKVLADYFEKGDWKDNVETVLDTKKPKSINEKFFLRFFKPDFVDALDDAAQTKFVLDMYNLSLVTGLIQEEVMQTGKTVDEMDIRSFFSCSEVEAFSKVSAAELYYKGGPGDDKTGVQVRAAAPLLVNFLNTTDAYSLSKTIGADIRMTTPEVVASFATLMNLKNVSNASSDPAKFDKDWKIEETLPLSANIQWILYQGTTPDTRTTYLIKFLLNEREVTIDGLKMASYPYYKWDDVKAYYTKRLSEELEITKLNDNMHTYLVNMKKQ